MYIQEGPTQSFVNSKDQVQYVYYGNTKTVHQKLGYWPAKVQLDGSDTRFGLLVQKVDNSSKGVLII